MQRVVLALVAWSACATSLATPRLELVLLDDGPAAVSPAYLGFDIDMADLGTGNAWRNATCDLTATNGAQLVFATDPASGDPVILSPDRDGLPVTAEERYVTFVSLPRPQEADERFGLDGQAQILGNAANDGAVRFDAAHLDVRWRRNPGTDERTPGYIVRVMLDLNGVSLPLGMPSVYAKFGAAPRDPADTLLASGEVTATSVAGSIRRNTVSIFVGSWDCNQNGVYDALEDLVDCDTNGVPDVCDLRDPTLDCDQDGLLDVCRGQVVTFDTGWVAYDHPEMRVPLPALPFPTVRGSEDDRWLSIEAEYRNMPGEVRLPQLHAYERTSGLPGPPCWTGVASPATRMARTQAWAGLLSSNADELVIWPEYNEADCNAPAVRLVIRYQAEPDINQNGVVDACEELPDCDADGIADVHAIEWCWFCPIGYLTNCAAASCWDCNGNGIPDSCDIRDCPPGDLLCADADGDGRLDGCFPPPDCDGDGVPDTVTIANCPPGERACADCNNNGVPDGCDLAACAGGPLCEDCDGDGLMNECEAGTLVDLETPFIEEDTLYVLRSVPRAISDVHVEIAGSGPTSFNYFGRLYFETTVRGDLWLRLSYFGWPDCYPRPRTMMLSAAEWNGARRNDEIELMHRFEGFRSGIECNPNGASYRFRYATVARDCDGNSVPDECEIGNNTCNCGGDFDRSGAIDLGDLAAVLEHFGARSPASGDANADGVTNLTDLSIVLQGLGCCCE